jgi:aminoglycoside 6'-N-acetyltransferase
VEPATGSIAFRPLDDADLPMLHGWLNDPGVVTWWEGDDVSWDGVVADYGAAARAEHDTEHWITTLDGRPIGWIQCYPVSSSPEEAEVWWAHDIDRDAAGIDYLIGPAEDRGRGVGTAVIVAFVHGIVFGRHPHWTQACAAPFAANRASWRVLERAGFRQVADIDDPDGPCRLMAFDRPR